MNKLKELIEAMEADYDFENALSVESSCIRAGIQSCIAKAKSLQEEEPIMYTQEEMDKACKDAYERAIKFYGEPFIPDPSKQKIA